MGNGLIFGNRILDIVLISLVIAQTLKVILGLFTEKKINFRRFLDTGNMPSSHTASVVSLATAIGKEAVRVIGRHGRASGDRGDNRAVQQFNNAQQLGVGIPPVNTVARDDHWRARGGQHVGRGLDLRITGLRLARAVCGGRQDWCSPLIVFVIGNRRRHIQMHRARAPVPHFTKRLPHDFRNPLPMQHWRASTPLPAFSIPKIKSNTSWMS